MLFQIAKQVIVVDPDEAFVAESIQRQAPTVDTYRMARKMEDSPLLRTNPFAEIHVLEPGRLELLVESSYGFPGVFTQKPEGCRRLFYFYSLDV